MANLHIRPLLIKIQRILELLYILQVLKFALCYIAKSGNREISQNLKPLKNHNIKKPREYVLKATFATVSFLLSTPEDTEVPF